MIKKKQQGKRKNTFILLTLLLLFSFSVLIISTNNKNTEPENLSYVEFSEKLKNKEISEVSINIYEPEFTATDTNKAEYIVENPKYENFKKDLLEAGVKVEELKTNNIFTKILSVLFSILEFGFFIFIAFLLYSQVTGKNMVEKINKNNNAKDSDDNSNKVTFKDVAGLSQVKDELKLTVDFLKDPKKYLEAGAKLPKGILLVGPPGTGKTLLAKAIAGEADAPFLSVSGSDFIEMFAGVGAKRVRELFQKAQKQSPCIIFIDEIDAIGGKRENSLRGNGEQIQTINALLSEMDGFNGSEGVLVIAATNRVEDLDSALIRPGRFDKHITVPLPETTDERIEIINLYTKNKKLADDVDVDVLAKETLGFSPADIEVLLNEAALISVQKNKDFIDMECIDDAVYKKLLKGHAKEDKNRDQKELELVAWHEAGHATIAKLCDMDVSKVTIVKSTSGAGGVNIIVPKKLGLYSIKELEDQIKMCYGGRCAEKILYGNDREITTGAQSDIQQATGIIREMIKTYGMTDKYKMLNLNMLNLDDEKVMETAIEIAGRLEKETMDLLNKHHDIHKEIANVLLKKETINSKELDEIYRKYI